MDASPDLIPVLLGVTSIHVFGAGLNAERTSHTAVPELRRRGWRVVPVHPRDAGACIDGVPIRGSVEPGTPLEVAVLFLAPERARAQVRRLLMTPFETPPLVWFQPGAEDESRPWVAERCRMDNRSCRLHCSLFRTAQPLEGTCRPPLVPSSGGRGRLAVLRLDRA